MTSGRSRILGQPFRVLSENSSTKSFSTILPSPVEKINSSILRIFKGKEDLANHV